MEGRLAMNKAAVEKCFEAMNAEMKVKRRTQPSSQGGRAEPLTIDNGARRLEPAEFETICLDLAVRRNASAQT